MPRTSTRAVISVTLMAMVGAIVVYLPTLWFGFRYDDYHEMRPWTGAELRGVFHGTWDPTGIESRFYRPLTACWYALRFAVFGINGVAQHALSIATMALCGTLAGVFVWRTTQRMFPAVLAAGLFEIHPVFVYAQAVWLTNQMHLAASALVLTALLVWQRACAKGGAAWGALIIIQVIAFGFKEDTIVLLPLLALLTLIRRWMRYPVHPPSRVMMLVAAAVVLGLPYWRYVALGRHLGGYGRPPFQRGMENLRRGLDVLLQRPAHRPWQAFAGRYSAAVLVIGTATAAIRRRPDTVFVIACGLVTAFAFNLPFYLVSKPEQYHLVGLGCVLALTGAIDGVQWIARPRAVRISAAVTAVLGALPLLFVTNNIVQDFAPCSAPTLYTDSLVVGWNVVPFEIRSWIAAKPQACAAHALQPLDQSLATATWALGLEGDETGAQAEWTAHHGVVFVRRGIERANFVLRTPIASADSPVSVTLRYDGNRVPLILTDPSWHTQTVHFRPTILARLRTMDRLDIDVAPVFIPAIRFRNGDQRVLGILMRILQPIAR